MSQGFAKGNIGPTGGLGPTGPQGPTGATGPAVNKGTATLNFGATPGTNSTTVAVVGQGSILSTSLATAVMMGDTTSDHNAVEHQMVGLDLVLTCSIPTNGVGFTITAYSTLRLTGTFTVRWFWA